MHSMKAFILTLLLAPLFAGATADAASSEQDKYAKYSNFDPDLDEIAAYGIGALVAGKFIEKKRFFGCSTAIYEEISCIIYCCHSGLFETLF